MRDEPRIVDRTVSEFVVSVEPVPLVNPRLAAETVEPVRVD